MKEITETELATLKLKLAFETQSNPRLFWLVKLGEAQQHKRRILAWNKRETRPMFRVSTDVIDYRIEELAGIVEEYSRG